MSDESVSEQQRKCIWCGKPLNLNGLNWGRNIIGEKACLHDNCFQKVWSFAISARVLKGKFDEMEKLIETEASNV